MIHHGILERIVDNRAKVLFAIASGEDLTKLEIKQRSSLSMSTVISAVDALVKEGIVTLRRQKVRSGGKPHSVINIRSDKCVYGISYKGGKLTAISVDLKGRTRRLLCVQACEPPREAVISLLLQLDKEDASPLAIAVAVNCGEREEIAAALREKWRQARVILTSNIAALAYRALWQGEESPVAVIGAGNRIKCALLGEKECRVVELDDLPSALAVAGRGEYASLLSATRVEKTLREKDYRGHLFWEGDEWRECRDLPSYSRALARAFVALVETVERLTSPRTVCLFGEYLTEAFFDRIQEGARVSCALRRLAGERKDFAYAAATVALTEGVFS